MESCTAGQIASLITDTEGASAIIKGAFVTYSNEAKIRQGVPEDVIRKYGVYSKETASEMARVCREFYAADNGGSNWGRFSLTHFVSKMSQREPSPITPRQKMQYL